MAWHLRHLLRLLPTLMFRLILLPTIHSDDRYVFSNHYFFVDPLESPDLSTTEQARVHTCDLQSESSWSFNCVVFIPLLQRVDSRTTVTVNCVSEMPGELHFLRCWAAHTVCLKSRNDCTCFQHCPLGKIRAHMHLWKRKSVHVHAVSYRVSGAEALAEYLISSVSRSNSAGFSMSHLLRSFTPHHTVLMLSPCLTLSFGNLLHPD